MMTDAERDKIVKHLGKQLRAVVDVAVELEEVGDLANVRDEAKKIAASAGEERNQALADRDAALEELSNLDVQVAENREKASDIINAAKTKGTGIVSAAEIKAGGMIAVAQQKVTGLEGELDRLKHTHAKAIETYSGEEEAARERVEVIAEELARLEKRLSG